MNGRKPNPYKIAILWRGDREARRAATAQNNRFYRIFEELAELGIHVEPAVYDEDFADEVREQLLAGDGVLVWVDPIHQGKTRTTLDPLLRDVASRGPWVSAHPDVILKMGGQGSPASHEASGMGNGYSPLSHRGRFSRRVPVTAPVGMPARHQAEPGQWRPRSLESRARFAVGRQGKRGACAAGAAGERT